MGAKPLVASGLFVIVTLMTIAFSFDQGIARDEVVYIEAGDRYAAWWRESLVAPQDALDKKQIEKTFGKAVGGRGNAEHPPLVKTMIGFSIWLFHDQLQLTSRVTAARIPGALLFAALVVLVFLFGYDNWDRYVGLGAAAALAFMPRLVFHAGFACFDVAVAFFWMVVVYCYSRALTSITYCCLLGVALGCALATKHNALILPLVIFSHLFILWWRFELTAGFAAEWSTQRRLAATLGGSVAVCAIGGVSLLALHPLLVTAIVTGVGILALVGRGLTVRNYIGSTPTFAGAVLASCLHLSSLTLLALLIGSVFLAAQVSASIMWIFPLLLLVGFGLVVGVRLTRHEVDGDEPAVFFPHPLIALAFLIAPLVLFISWPKLWVEPGHVGKWIAFHLKHVHYNFEFAGQNLNHPPFPRTIVPSTLWATVPLATLVAALLGAAAYAADRFREMYASPRMPLTLIVLSGVIAVAPFFLSDTPVFGAEKHWLAVMPTIAILAGIGLRFTASLALGSIFPRLQRIVRPFKPLNYALIVCIAAAGLSETLASRPFGLTHYVAQVGGPSGAATKGYNRQYWGYAAKQAAPLLNKWAREENARFPVYGHDADMAFGLYHETGGLDQLVQHAGREETGIRKSTAAIVIHELHFNRHDYLIWRDYGTLVPYAVITHHGVPVVSIYHRSRRFTGE